MRLVVKFWVRHRTPTVHSLSLVLLMKSFQEENWPPLLLSVWNGSLSL
jgi:hypothetical protein